MLRAERKLLPDRTVTLPRVRLLPRLLLAFIVLSPSPALANAGIGFFMVGLPFVLLALVPAIPLEALVLAAILRVDYRRALSYSWRANVRSTIYGLGLGIAFDIAMMAGTGSSGPEPTKAVATTVLIFMYFFSWWIEHRAIARLATEFSKSRIALATGAANLLSYTAMVVLVWVTAIYPERGAMTTRARVYEAMLASSGIKSAITEYWEANKRLPPDARGLEGALPESGKYRVAVNTGGRISVLIVMPDQPDIDGKHIVFTPIPDVSPGVEALRWECSAPEIKPKYLPATCREQ